MVNHVSITGARQLCGPPIAIVAVAAFVALSRPHKMNQLQVCVFVLDDCVFAK